MKSKTKKICILTIVSIATLLLYTQITGAENRVVINEVMRLNSTTIRDESGEFHDWIELYNAGESPVRLGGYGLSDDESEPLKWRFPDMSIAPGDYIVVFASDKDTIADGFYYSPIIERGDIWKYKVWNSDTPEDWYGAEYDDSGWKNGASGFGIGDGDDETEIPISATSVHIRKTFSLDTVSTISGATLHIDFDDGFVAYLNGVEIARSNLGKEGVPVPYDEYAKEHIEAMLFRNLPPADFEVANAAALVRKGTNILAIQGHDSEHSSDVTLIPMFSLLMADEDVIHTNFKIKNGETITLSDSTGTVLDRMTTGFMEADISQGRLPDGSDTWLYFEQATPGKPNNTEGSQGLAPAPLFSIPGGFYDTGTELTISSEPGTTVRYTLDNTEPSDSSTVAQSPLRLSETVVVKAKTFKPGYEPSPTVTHTYIIGEQTTLPVVSISAHPDDMFNKYGIYPNYKNGWERQAHIEFFEPDGTLGLSMNCGIQVHGASSAGFAQKPLAFYARSKYGSGSFKYQIFPDIPIDSFEAFILRNSGNDWGYSMMRDALITSLTEGTDVAVQAYRPVAVYINGDYWGIHNAREKINEHFIASHYDVNPDSIDVMEYVVKYLLIHGDSRHFYDMIDYMERHDLAQDRYYEHVKTLIDIEQFIDYFVIGVYADSGDWPGNNVKLWRPKTPDGKWRWILYDTDVGFAHSNFPSSPENNKLVLATHPDKDGWGNYGPWSTIIVRNLLKNEQFRNRLINRFSDFMNSRFLAEVVLERIERMQETIRPEMPRHFKRWGGSMRNWETQLNYMRDFARRRNHFLKNHIRDYFGIDSNIQVMLDYSQEQSGSLRINSLDIETLPWSGYYFSDVPITFTALPNPDYFFERWDCSLTGTSETIVFSSPDTIDLTAVFARYDNPPYKAVVINEINYNSSDDFDTGDWIELHNTSDMEIDLSGWIFMDEDDNTFLFPDGGSIAPGGYYIALEDSVLFKDAYPYVRDYSGNFGFGLSGGGEKLRLYTPDKVLADSLIYDDIPPWPVEPDGYGATLALLDPDFDNALAESWIASAEHGTPGRDNALITHIRDNTDSVPLTYSLEQNFPNPFNQSTTIHYNVPEQSFVTIDIYNVLGQKTESLVSKNHAAGIYDIHYDAGENTSGMYFCLMKAGTFTAVKRIILVK